LAGEAESVARSAEFVQHEVYALAELIHALTIAGDSARANLLADEAERAVFAADPDERAEPCDELIHVLVATQSHDRAVEIANRAAEQAVLDTLIRYLCLYEQADYAAEVAHGIDDPSIRDKALRLVAEYRKPSTAAGPAVGRPAGTRDAKSKAGELVEKTRAAAVERDHTRIADLADRPC
jgi:hypothetical protein